MRRKKMPKPLGSFVRFLWMSPMSPSFIFFVLSSTFWCLFAFICVCELQGFLSVSSVARQPMTKIFKYIFCNFVFLLTPFKPPSSHTHTYTSHLLLLIHACILHFYPNSVSHTSFTSMPTASHFFFVRSWFSVFYLVCSVKFNIFVGEYLHHLNKFVSSLSLSHPLSRLFFWYCCRYCYCCCCCAAYPFS